MSEVGMMPVIFSKGWSLVANESGIDPAKPVELRVEFTRLGHGKTLLRIVQGPYTSEAAQDYSDGWESILNHLQEYLDATQSVSS